MSQRVLATESALQAARQMQSVLNGGIQHQVRQLLAHGQTLSNPNAWDSREAADFRQRSWPGANRSLTQSLQSLGRLQADSESVIRGIIAAGDNGSVRQDVASTLGFAKWAYGVYKDDIKPLKPILKGGKGLYTSSKAYASWLANTIKEGREWSYLDRPVSELMKDVDGFVGAVNRWSKYTEEAGKAMKSFTGGVGELADPVKLWKDFEFDGFVGEQILSRLGTVGKFLGVGGKVIGKLALPLTIVSGIQDAFTGGGYSGWRGWTDRGMGILGAVGAGVLIAGEFALIANPVGLGIAGAAVLAYGAWQLGNLIYDNRQAIAHAATAAWKWGGDMLLARSKVPLRLGSNLIPQTRVF